MPPLEVRVKLVPMPNDPTKKPLAPSDKAALEPTTTVKPEEGELGDDELEAVAGGVRAGNPVRVEPDLCISKLG